MKEKLATSLRSLRKSNKTCQRGSVEWISHAYYLRPKYSKINTNKSGYLHKGGYIQVYKGVGK